MTENDLIEIVSYIKGSKAMGIEKIRPRDIKVCIEKLKLILLKLHNSISNSGAIPRELKTAIVSSTHKSRERNQVLNYRPTCLSSLSKYITKTIR